MIDRYTLPEMKALWEDQARFETWLQIEIFACEAWASIGTIPSEEVQVIKKTASFSLEEIRRLEEKNHHEVIAFLESLGKSVGPPSRYIHYGLTSSDVMDTALAVTLQRSSDLILKETGLLREAVARKAGEYKGVPAVGRTHGVHAEPVTFGLKLLSWVAELDRNKERMTAARKEVSVGKISGAVGTYAHLNPRVEEYVCKKLNLEPDPISTQIVARDRHAHYLASLAILSGTLERMATEIRNLQRTEVLEVEEPFGEGQKGSSAMPHKRNPVMCERICGLARVVRGNALVGLENISLWHERDISHSSAERVVLADSSILAHYLLRSMTGIVRDLHVYPERMKRNLELTGGLIYSQRLLLALVKTGISREEAYGVVQSLARKAWNVEHPLSSATNFQTLVLEDQKIGTVLSGKELEEIFRPDFYLAHEDEIYGRFNLPEEGRARHQLS